MQRAEITFCRPGALGKRSCSVGHKPVQKIPHCPRNRHPQDDEDQPWRHGNPLYKVSYVAVGSEGPNGDIVVEVSEIHQAQPERKQHPPGAGLDFWRVKQVAGEKVEEYIPESDTCEGNQGNLMPTAFSEERGIVNILINLHQAEQVQKTEISIVQGERILLALQQPCGKGMRIFMCQIGKGVGEPDLQGTDGPEPGSAKTHSAFYAGGAELVPRKDANRLDWR